jgi:FkbM family methyltransferase
MAETIRTFSAVTRFHAPAFTSALYRNFPKFKGYWHLLEQTARWLPRRATVFDAEVILDGKTYRLPVDVRDPYQIDIFAKNKQELCVPAAMALLLDTGDFYVDVGANAGWYCRFMAQCVGDSGLILAMEPNDRAFRHLRKLAYRNFLPLPFAATAENGALLGNTSSVFQQAASTKFKHIKSGADYGVGERFVLGRSLDHLLSEFRRSPRVIKIDVEGAELHVLRGATRTLDNVQGVMIEVNEDSTCAQYGYRFNEIYDLMEKAGFSYKYEARNSDNTLYRLAPGERLPSDIFFTRRELQP